MDMHIVKFYLWYEIRMSHIENVALTEVKLVIHVKMIFEYVIALSYIVEMFCLLNDQC